MKSSFAPALSWRKLPLVAFLCFVLNCSLLSAQSADAEEDEDDVIQLMDLVVSVDDGRSYTANNSNSATSFNVQLRDLPVPISVVTKQFIEDQGATDFREALSYEAGVTFQNEYNPNAGFTAGNTSQDVSPSSSAVPTDPFSNAIIIRGYNSPSQQRLGFRVGASVPVYNVNFGGATDTVNTARQETVYGPQSLLYGINVLSGVVNIIPKQPVGERGGELRLTLGSRSFRRGSLEYEDVISKEHGLYYRVAGAYTEKGDVVDFVNTEEEYYVGQLLWEPNKSGNTYPKYRVFLELQHANKFQRGARGKMGGSNMNSTRMPVDNRGDFDRFLNPQGSNFTYGYDFDPDAVQVAYAGGLDTNSLEGFTRTRANLINYLPAVIPEGTSYLVRNPGNSYDFPRLGDYYNFSGPDQFHDFEEFDALGLINLELFEGLGVELGAYYTETSTDRRVVDYRIYNLTDDTLNSWELNPEVMAALNGKTFDETAVFLSGLEELFVGEKLNNNVDKAPLSETLGLAIPYSQYKVLGYQYSYGKVDSESIQLRARVNYKKDTSWFDGRMNATHNFAGGISYINDQVEFVNPAGIDTTSFSGSNYYSKGLLVDGGSVKYPSPKFDSDAISFQNIFDYTPLRYDPSKMSLAFPGGQDFNNLGEDSQGTTLDVTNSYIARSGWREANLYFKGFFGVYYGQFFDNRLTLIGGVRHDAYQVRERRQLTAIQRTENYSNVDDINADNPNWFGSAAGQSDEAWLPTGVLLGYGDTPYRDIPSFSKELNDKIRADYEAYRQSHPQGTTEYSFPEDQKFTSKTAGFSFRVVDELSLYYIYSEGIFPNTGQVDGAGDAIEAESTTNNEIGIKFELFDGRLSGSASFYEIIRENATWQWGYAPGPQRWWGGDEAQGTEIKTNFNPAAIGTIVDGKEVTWRYSVAQPYVNRVARLMGLTIDPRKGPDKLAGFSSDYGTTGTAGRSTGGGRDGTGYNSNQIVADYRKMQDVHASILDGSASAPDGLKPYVGENKIYLDYEGNILEKRDDNQYYYLIDSDEYNVIDRQLVQFDAGDVWDGSGKKAPTAITVGNPIKLAMDLAVHDQSAPGLPFSYLADGAGIANDVYAHNASTINPSGGAAGEVVKYEEKGIGYSFGLNWLILKNWSLKFDYSFSKREVTGGGFILADGYRRENGEIVADSGYNDGRYTTEYDHWVYILGIDNFEDPTDPTTLKAGSLSGLDLSFIPRHNANIWTKYEFIEGPLKGLEIGGGMKYTSSSPTTAPIGGRNLAENRYPTPDVPERFEFDGMISYRGEFGNGMRYQIQLNVKNILDDHYVVSYGNTEYAWSGTEWETEYVKRTVRFYNPREYRLSFTLSF